jgi:hypothetical protein
MKVQYQQQWQGLPIQYSCGLTKRLSIELPANRAYARLLRLSVLQPDIQQPLQVQDVQPRCWFARHLRIRRHINEYSRYKTLLISGQLRLT